MHEQPNPETDATVVDPILMGTLVELDAEIASDDRDADLANASAIQHRWEFGHFLLNERRGGDQLPKGLLDAVAARTGTHRSELQHRYRLAKVYATAESLDAAIREYRTWTAVRASLSRTRSLAVVPAEPHPGRKAQAAALDGDRARVARQWAEQDADEARYGPSRARRSMTLEATQLDEALNEMVAGARTIERLIGLAPMLPLVDVVAEVGARTVLRRVEKARAVLDAVGFAAFAQTAPPSVPAAVREIDPNAMRLDLGDADEPLMLDAGEAEAA